MVGLPGSLPSPHPRAPTREESSGPRPAGLLRPGSAAPPDHPLPSFHPSFLPGLSSPPLCSQNGNQENPCCGIDGILEAYHHSLRGERTVQLYGPISTSPLVVTHVAR